MKKIDQLLLRSFIGPFLLTFGIAMFVLIMQFLWKYVDDLVGKGLDNVVLAKLIFYLSASVVPLALPIAILLSAIMTLGSLGEHYELVSFKSAGVSLFRIMRPLLILTLGLSMGAFLFANYVLPVSNLKFMTLLYSVTKKRPALNIKEGVYYNGIDGYVIRVGEKEEGSRFMND
ncbi:MAG TPA: LptF/LptG family permease, partial [Chitinophagales bacterium]|nr:LptF/LptG family permease [Chitinophagales bacterium]